MLTFIFLLLKYALLTIIFAATGNIIRNKIAWYENYYSIFFWIAADYFIGYILYFFSIRTLGLFIPFSTSTYIAIFVFVLFIILQRKKVSITLKEYIRFVFYIISIFIFQLTFIVAYWVQNSLNNVFSIIGSLHSPRYANIAHYIIINDKIPIIGQNYSQSVMAATPLIFGGNIILVSLTTFLAINISFFWLFLNGFLKRFFTDKTAHFFATILVMCGGISLSFRYVLLVDSGWPWLLSGYSDTIVGLASFVIILLLLIRHFSVEPQLKYNWLIIITGINIVSWFALAIQNVVIISALFGIFTCVQYYKKTLSAKIFIPFFLTFFCASIIGIVGGGMLTPSGLQTKTNIPGTMAVKQKNMKAISIKPGYPYFIMINSTDSVKSAFGSVDFALREDEGLSASNHKLFYKSFYALGLKVVFIPILTFVLSLYWIKKTKDDFLRIIIYCTLLFFLIGLAIAFPFNVFQKKWELSRFLIPGYFFIAVLTAIMFYNWGNLLKLKLGKIFLISVTIFLCIGPACGIYRIIYNNFNKKDFHKNFNDFKSSFDNFIIEDLDIH